VHGILSYWTFQDCVCTCVCGNSLPRIYAQLRQTINMSDASKDLKWWSQNHGIEMPMLWPTFEVIIVSSTTLPLRLYTLIFLILSLLWVILGQITLYESFFSSIQCCLLLAVLFHNTVQLSLVSSWVILPLSSITQEETKDICTVLTKDTKFYLSSDAVFPNVTRLFCNFMQFTLANRCLDSGLFWLFLNKFLLLFCIICVTMFISALVMLPCVNYFDTGNSNWH